MKLRHILLALALALPAVAQAGNCPNMMAEVDAALAENPKLEEDVMKEVKTLREEGEKLHAEGKHDKSVEALTQALLLLGKM